MERKEFRRELEEATFAGKLLEEIFLKKKNKNKKRYKLNKKQERAEEIKSSSHSN